MISALPKSLLWISESTVNTLLQYYDYPHPEKPGEIIEGYDKDHALRTAKMCSAIAHYLGHDAERVRRYQIACLLHDLGRAGLDQKLFGKIWTWARRNRQPMPTIASGFICCLSSFFDIAHSDKYFLIVLSCIGWNWISSPGSSTPCLSNPLMRFSTVAPNRIFIATVTASR